MAKKNAITALRAFQANSRDNQAKTFIEQACTYINVTAILSDEQLSSVSTFLSTELNGNTSSWHVLQFATFVNSCA